MTTMTMIESNILNEYGVYRKFSNKKKKNPTKDDSD